MPESRRPEGHEMRRTVERMRAGWEAQEGALVAIRHFYARLSTKGYSFLAKGRSGSWRCPWTAPQR